MNTLLPRVDYPLFDLEIPSTKQKIKVRQILVKDEKILLMAKASTKETRNAAVLNAIKQIVQNCIVQDGFQEDININKLAMFDVDYLFVKLRALSVSNIIKASYTDNTDGPNGPVYPFEINLDDIQIKYQEVDPRIILSGKGNENVVITMKYPEASLYSNEEFQKATDDNMMNILLKNSIAQIGLIKVSDLSLEEFSEWIDNLPLKTHQQIQEYLSKLPTMYYEINYKNTKKEDRKIVLQSLTDFFTF